MEPQNTTCIDRVYEAANRLFVKIQALDQRKLPISAYNIRYLGDLKNDLADTLNKYALILVHIAHGNAVAIEDLRFLDYGGGTGLLSILACEAGMREVVYNDIYDVSCHDSAVIAEALGYPNIVRIEGDFDAVQRWCEQTEARFDGIGSYDVIEHIYDIKDHLANLHTLCTATGHIFLCSSANSCNLQIVARLVDSHMNVEMLDREKKPGHKERDSLQAYATTRQNIIRTCARSCSLELSEKLLKELTRATRGLRRDDIKKAVATCAQTGALPVPDTQFPSNTCDPLTGNWNEHLMDFQTLTEVLTKNGFAHSSVYPDPEHLPTSPIIALYARRS